jgi:hypothetical protein
MNDELDFQIEFSDPTILETEGIYSNVKDLMDKELFGKHSWMLESHVVISSQFGVAEMILHFCNNGDIYITEFVPSIKGDVFYNPDIRCISMWAQENGWHVPKPHPDLVRMDLGFWKHFWETGLVDSELLDKKFGKRDDYDDIEEDNDEE